MCHEWKLTSKEIYVKLIKITERNDEYDKTICWIVGKRFYQML